MRVGTSEGEREDDIAKESEEEEEEDAFQSARMTNLRTQISFTFCFCVAKPDELHNAS